MKKHRLLVVVYSFFSLSCAFGQMEMSIKYLTDEKSWGVYIRPDATIHPSQNTITGSGQVTVVAPRGFVLAPNDLTSVAGLWLMNSRANGPAENPFRDYISFGFSADTPPIRYSSTSETLLFKFKKNGNCPDTLFLIDNAKDPFNRLPNSVNSNPGNDMAIFDIGAGGRSYFYSRNYQFEAWDCDPNNTNVPPFAVGAQKTDPDCAGNSNGVISLDINGGVQPYTIQWSDGASTDTRSGLGVGAYAVTVTDAGGARSIHNFNLTYQYSDCVWPGDANDDGKVDHFDLLKIGMHYNKRGIARTVNTSWQAYPVTNWTAPNGTTVNPKHSDSNGSGAVSEQDVAAILQHFSKEHPFNPNDANDRTPMDYPVNSAVSPIRVVPGVEELLITEDIRIPVLLQQTGEKDAPVMALAFGFEWTNDVAQPGTLAFEFEDNFLAENNHKILTLNRLENGNFFYLACSRTDGQSLIGEGKIGDLVFKLKPELQEEESIELNIAFGDDAANPALKFMVIDHQEQEIPLEKTNSVVTLVKEIISSTEAVDFGARITFLPNPAKNNFSIITNGISIQRLSIYDVAGKNLLDLNGFTNYANVNIESLPSGLYFVRGETNEGSFVKKLIVE